MLTLSTVCWCIGLVLLVNSASARALMEKTVDLFLLVGSHLGDSWRRYLVLVYRKQILIIRMSKLSACSLVVNLENEIKVTCVNQNMV